MTSRAAIVAAARGWLGTRWVHQGRLRGVGVDCVGLVIGAARDSGALDGATLQEIEVQIGAYGLRPDGRLLELCRRYLRPRPLQDIAAGDVLVLRFDADPQHLALLGDGPHGLTLIHAAARLRRVVEHRLDELWRARAVAAFALPVED